MAARVLAVDEPDQSTDVPFLTNSTPRLRQGPATPMQHQGPATPAERAGVDFEANIYDSIVVAAFGGVTQTLAKAERTRIHPAVLFMLALPLLVMQASMLFFIRLDRDLQSSVWDDTVDTDDEVGKKRRDMLLYLKVILMIIAQLVLFSKILGTMRLLVFVMNPSTWDEIVRPDPELMNLKHGAWVFRRAYLAPFAFLAMVIHMSINYTVCVDSVSIILGSDSVKNAIYDSLSITFIADLPVTWWTVLATIFHFDSFSNFEFKLADPLEVEHRAQRSGWSWPRWTRRGYGARRVEIVISFCLMVFLYCRQVFVVVQAIETNVLPMARDVCTLWRWATKQEKHMQIPAWLFRNFATKWLVLIDATDVLVAIADPNKTHSEGNTTKTGFCNETYDRLHWSGVRDMLLGWNMTAAQKEQHAEGARWSLVLLVLALCLPQVYYVSFHKVRPYFYDDDVADPHLAALQNEPQELEELIEDLRHEVRVVKAVVATKDADSQERDADECAVLRQQVESLQEALNQERTDLQALKAEVEGLKALRAEMEGRKDEAHAKKKHGFFLRDMVFER